MAKENPPSSSDQSTRRRLWGTVSGRVQKVGFRAFVCRHGDRLGLDGWVRNLPNGDVALDAAGPEDALQQLEEKLAKGPLFGRVDRLDLTRADADEGAPAAGSGFRVVP